MKVSLRRFFRYSLLAVAILFVLWILTITAVYFLVDSEDIKKLAVSAVNENTKGELSIGEVKLKVFPLVHFEIKELLMKSSTAFGRKEVFSYENSKLSFNVFTLIFGRPKITLVLRKPSLNVLSNGKKTNLDDLFESSKKSKPKSDFLAYLFVSKIHFDIRAAHVSYSAPNDTFDINGLNLNLEIEPVSRKVFLSMNSPIDYKKKGTFIEGNIKLDANVKMSSKEKTDIFAVVDASGISFTTGSFKKTRGDILKIELSADTDMKNIVNIKGLEIFLIDKLFSASGKIKNFMSAIPEIDLKAEVGPYDVKNFARLSSALKALNPSGILKSSLSLKGYIPLKKSSKQSADLGLEFELDGTDIAFNSKAFKKQKNIYMGLSLKGTTNMNSVFISKLSGGLDKIKVNASGSIRGLDKKYPSYNLNLEAPKFLLSNLVQFLPELSKYPVSGTLYLKAKTAGTMRPLPVLTAEASFKDSKTKNNLKLNISNSQKRRRAVFAKIYSSQINLDTYLPASEKSKLKKEANLRKKSGASGGTFSSKAQQDFELLKKEDLKLVKDSLKNYSLKLNSRIDKMNYQGISINNFIIDGTFDDKQLVFNKMKLALLKGSIFGAFKVALNLDKPVYNGKLKVKGLDVKDAAKVLMPNIGGVIGGIISTDLDFSASGYMMSDVKKTVVGKGSFSFNKFVYSAQKLNELISDKLKGKIGNLGNKKILGSNPGWETVQGDYTIKDQRINVGRLFAKEGEYEANGKGWLDFNEYMDMYVDLLLPYRNLPYEAIRQGTTGKSMLPVHLTGPIVKPKFDAGYLLEYLAKKSIEHETKKLKEAATKEVERIKQETKAKVDAETQKIKAKVDAEAKKAAQKLGDEIKKGLKGFKF